MKREEELTDALRNLLGVYDTPLSRRRFPQDDFMKEAIETARAALLATPKPEAEPLKWFDGVPPHPFDKEWFIAQTTFGDKVVLRALPEEYTYDFKTADDTYIKADKIKRWMQFPDSQYIPFSPPKPEAMEGGAHEKGIEAAAKALHEDMCLQDVNGYLDADINCARLAPVAISAYFAAHTKATAPETRHEFVPHKKYPWFCAHCGYAPHEPLKHIQPSTAALNAKPEQTDGREG